MICRICEKYKTCDSPYCGDSSMIHCGNYEETKPTNADHIRAMTDEELAEFMFRTFGRPAWCLDNNCQLEESCVPCWLEWLKQERENLNEQTN